MKTINIKNIIILIMLTTFICGIQNAYAGSLLFVAPNRIVIEPNQRTTVINVTNKDDRHREFNIILQNYIMTEAGSTQIVDNFKYSASRMVRYVPRRIKLAPGERQAIRIMARKPKDLADGDYHSHLLFDEIAPTPPQPGDKEYDESEKSNELKFKIEALYSLALPLVIQHGELHSELKITGAKIEQNEAGRYTATVGLDRSGNSEGTGFLTIEHKTDNGDIKMIGLGGDLHIYREVDSVDRTFPISIDSSTPINNLHAVLREGPNPKDKIISSQPVKLIPQENISIEN